MEAALCLIAARKTTSSTALALSFSRAAHGFKG